MKKFIYFFILLSLGWLIFENKILSILNHLFISSVIPYSWRITRIFLGVTVSTSIVLAVLFSGRGLFGALMAFICAIPALIAVYWLGCDVLGFLHWQEFNFDLRYWFLWWVFSGGFTAWFFLHGARDISGKITKWIDSKTHRPLTTLTSTEEIYKNHDNLKLKKYNPADYYDFKNRKIFMSLDVSGNPIYCDYDSFIKKSHGNSTGRSQTGKNVAIQNIAVQLLAYDEFVVMCDSKDGGDDVMAPILWKYANEYGKSYNYVELSLTAPPQFNILQLKDADFLKKILMQLARLEETDDMATSYYIQQDDAIAQKIAMFVANAPEEVTIYDIVTNHMDLFFDPKKKEQTSLQTALTKLSYKPCINAKNGFKYDDLIRGGGCLYIQAKTKDENAILSVLISSLRFIRSQERISKIVTVIGDEFMKYASQDFIDIFTEGAGKGFKLITAYQTSALLEIKQIGLSSEQMLSVIMSNNSYEYIYGTRDPLILEVFEEHYAGTKIIHEETKDTETSILLTDKSTGTKKLKKVLHARYPKELLTKLRTGEHFLYVAGELLELCYNGYLPLLSGEFNKDSEEFLQMVDKARALTQVHVNNNVIERSDCGGEEVHAGLNQLPQTPLKALKNRFS
ncbi:MAG: hypothetical protein E6Q32_05375 [Neisseriales bacterium]|nr:MAG: hypothetical protein E6Q32_05375 [Neisseriales bacterium]